MVFIENLFLARGIRPFKHQDDPHLGIDDQALQPDEFHLELVKLVIVFFVTSADSGALVVNMLSSHGRDDTPLWQRIFWCFLIGVVAIALLLAGGLGSLQTAVIASALPFSAILLIAMYGLI